MTIKIPGYATITGNPTTIVHLLQDARLLDQPTVDLDEYIKSVQQTAWRCYGISLNVTGTTIPERAESLLREMQKHDLITITE